MAIKSQLGAVGLGLLGLALVRLALPRDKASAPVLKPPQTQASKEIGYKGHLTMGDRMSHIAVPRTEAALDTLLGSLETKDEESFNKLAMGDKLMLLETGTSVQVVGQSGKRLKIQVLESDFRGETGWVAKEWVQ